MTEATSAEFLLYLGSSDILAFDLLPTLPTVLMLIEFPCNMIPIDWPMLIFVELLFTFYMLINVIIVSFEPDHQNIYAAFNWYHEPGQAFAYLSICYVLLAIFFSIFWFITTKCKLPNYR